MKPRWIVLGCLLCFALIRMQPVHLYTLEWDEANELALAKLPTLWEIIRVNAIREFHPPMFPMLLHGWIGLLGDSDFWVRNFTWLWGVIGLGAGYLLALEISRSRRLALGVMALSVFSPFLWHYASITTFYAMYYALVLLSWFFLLKLCRYQPADRSLHLHWAWIAAYFLSSMVAIYLHAGAAVFLVFQAGFVLYQTRLYQKAPWLAAPTIGVWLLLLASYLPYLWSINQPWHVSHTLDPPGYAVVPFWLFLYSPANLLFLGYDVRDIHSFPGLFPALGVAGITAALLWAGGKTVWRLYRRHLALLLCIGVWPLLLMYAASLVSGMALFQYRALLFALFVLHFAVSAWVFSRFRGKAAMACLAGLMLLQLGNPYKRPYWPDTGNVLAANVQAHYQPGDGIVIYPGWMNLVFMRYFDPPEYGLSQHERHFDPLRENYLNMPNRMDERYFFISGEETWRRPDVRAAFRAFQARHQRIWMLTEPSPALRELLDCKREYMMLKPDGTFQPFRCEQVSLSGNFPQRRHKPRAGSVPWRHGTFTPIQTPALGYPASITGASMKIVSSPGTALSYNDGIYPIGMKPERQG